MDGIGKLPRDLDTQEPLTVFDVAAVELVCQPTPEGRAIIDSARLLVFADRCKPS